MYCSPNVNIKKHYTCFDYNELQQIALAFNIYIQKNKICPQLNKNSNKLTDKRICKIKRLININKPQRELWYSIYNRLKYICPYEYCWVDLDFINNIEDKYLKEKLKYFTFKPKITQGMNAWLTTQDINNVMQQYQDFYSSFKFLGALPSDFYKLISVDFSKIFDHNQIGIIFNLDNHTQKGSHWVSFLIDNENKTIEYYDSAGKYPNKNIQQFIDKIHNYISKRGLVYKIHYNTVRHQLENNECGVYAIYFIICRLSGRSFNNIVKNGPKDKDMNHFRQYIFLPQLNRGRNLKNN
jgi:hypothetical protein